MTTCNYCNKEVNNEARFCEACGHNIILSKLESGDTLYHNRYIIVSPLGSGGMGSVYLAEDLNLDSTKCVIKVMTDEFKDSSERNYAIQKFKDEAVMLARLRHNNLPVVQNHFIEEGLYCLVMDYIQGQSLDEILYDAISKDCLLSEELVVNWAVQVCDILNYLHTRNPPIIHRDIKPDNLMETVDGRVVLIDFGVARILSKKKSGSFVGTAGYAAPEQYTGLAYPQSDIFALGGTLHQLLTGYDPADADELLKSDIFTYPPLEEFRDDLTPGIQEIILKAMAIKIKNRFESAGEMKDILLRFKENPYEIKAPLKTNKSHSLRLKKKIAELGKKYSSSAKKIDSEPLLPEWLKFSKDVINQEELVSIKEGLSKIRGLDIGSYEIKLLQVDIDDEGHIYPKVISSERTPENSISSGIITNPEVISKIVKSMIKDHKDLEVITSLSPYSYSIRTIKFPFTPEEKLSEALSPGLKQLIPLPLEDCHVEYEILSSSIEGNEKNMKVRVTATRRSAYENLKKTLELAGLKSDNIVLEACVLTILSRVIIQDEYKKKNIAIVNMGSDGTSLNLIKDGILAQSSFFPCGGKKFTQALMQAEGVDFEKAEEIKKTECDADITWSKSTGFLQILILYFRDWRNEIEKSLKYFGPDYKIDKFDSIIFCGGSMQLKNLHKYISNQLGINSDKFFLPKSKSNIPEIKKELILEKGPSLMTAMGLVISYFKDIKEIEQLAGINKKLYRLTSLKLGETSLPESILSQDALLSKEMLDEFKRYMVEIGGPMAEIVFDECIKKTDYKKESIPYESIDMLIRKFIKEFSLSENKALELNRKIQEITSSRIETDKKDTTKKQHSTAILPSVLTMEQFEEFKSHLVLAAGPMAELAMNDCIRRAGYEPDGVPHESLNSLIDTFSIEFNLSPVKVSILKDHLSKLKVNKNCSISEKNKLESNKSELPGVINKETFEKLKTYLTSVSGPMAEIVLEKCIKKACFSQDSIPCERLDDIIEMFIKDFELSGSKVASIKEKIKDLKNGRSAGEGESNIEVNEKNEIKKKGFFSKLFGFGKK